MTTLEELHGFFSGKLKKEKLRLKSFGTKPDSFSLSYAIAPFILGYLSKARWEEITDLISWIRKKFPKDERPKSVKKILRYLIGDRQVSLCKMKDILSRVADEKEGKRPWKSKSIKSETTTTKKSSSLHLKKKKTGEKSAKDSSSDDSRPKKKHKKFR